MTTATSNTNPLTVIDFSSLMTVEFPPNEPYLIRNGQTIMHSKSIGQAFARRGIGKTLYAMTVAIIIASGGKASAFGMTAPKSRKVLFIDGEMSSFEIQTRFKMLAKHLGVTGDIPIRIIARDWQAGVMPRVDTPEGKKAFKEEIEWADVIFYDNRSCLFDPEGEKDPEAWSSAQDMLLENRRKNKASFIVHHTNRQGGARGHGKPEDIFDWSTKLGEPDEGEVDTKAGASFKVEWDKHRGFWGDAVIPCNAWLASDGWHWVDSHKPEKVMERRVIEVLQKAEESLTKTSITNKAKGNKQAILEAVDRLTADGILAFNAFNSKLKLKDGWENLWSA